MEKVSIYCRLSDEDRDKEKGFGESESIQNQKIMLTKYAMEKGWYIYKIYSDDDYSGLDIERPEFKKMIKDAEKGRFNIVLCKHQSRFSRDIEVVEKYLHRKFPEWGIRFISLTDYVDTLDDANKKSRQINSLVNEWYCEDISKAIRATFKVKREEGKFIGSFAPYGYEKDPKDKNRLIVDEKAARIIRMIFNWYLQGHGTQYIARILNKKGVPNPTRYKQEKGLKFKNSSKTDSYGLWNKTTVRRILRNEVYIGNLVQGKREKINYKSKKVVSKDKNDWIIVRGTHTPIVDYETFEAVQNRLNMRVRSTGKGMSHAFAGKVRCMDCKSSMNKVRTGKYEYLRCSLYNSTPDKKLCTSHSIRLDVLKNKVSEKLKEHIKEVSVEKLAYKLIKENFLTKEIKGIKKEIKNLDKLLNERNKIIQNLYIDKVNGVISEAQFIKFNKRFTDDKEKLLNRRDKLFKDIENIKQKKGNLNKWREIVIRYKNFDKLDHTMVNYLINYIEVGEKDKDNGVQKVRIHWKF
ncbi:recombinase family protein [Caldisalinibacter kiritimatiensis]|uniref:Site-specific recombinase n=1 Tax=Caldisalinibacter kiritimatiensis TaxID=1304284 RepID=R1CDU9_9FIRM|nr:recombinase family protein [Caldisalinibacter kiritimatiensis]EOD00455.1 Site-specific recombinase [Caldisalinibacter kiritimatiensis]